ILWKCEVQRKLNCHARLHTSLDNKVILKLIDTHNHSGNARSQHIRQFYENMKDEALQNHTSPHNVLTQCYMGVPDEIRAILPNNSNLKRDVRCWRQDKLVASIPADKNFQTVPDLYKKTSRGDNFLRTDTGPGNDRMLILCTDEQKQILETATVRMIFAENL
ncbi:unnamed protein product, partial [Didymodactylos carnosus]